MDLLALDNAQPKLAGGSTSRRITGTVYTTNLDASTSMAVGNTGLRSDRIKQANQTSDPGSLVAGDLWFRSDTGKVRYYDGSTTRELVDASTSGIPNPSTKATNDILQYNGATWDAVGAASGDRFTGTLYGSAMDLAGHLTFTNDNTYDIGASGATRPRTIYAGTSIYQGANQVLDTASGVANPASPNTNDVIQRTSGGVWVAAGGTVGDPALGPIFTQGITLVGTSNAAPLLWSTDNQNDIGASGATRPRTGYFGTSVVIAGQTAMKGGDSTGGDLSGTYPSTLTVAKIQGDIVSSATPTANQSLIYSGAQYVPRTQSWFNLLNTTHNSSAAYTIDGLVGDTSLVYEIILHGRWAATGAQRYIYLTPRTTGGDITANQYSHRHWAGVEPGIAQIHGINGVGSRLTLHQNDWSESQDIFVHAFFYAGTSAYNRRMISDSFAETAGRTGAGEGGKYIHHDFHSVWRDSTSAVAGLKIDFNSVTFTGRIIINAMCIYQVSNAKRISSDAVRSYL